MHLDVALKVLKNLGIKKDLPKSKKHLSYDSLEFIITKNHKQTN